MGFRENLQHLRATRNMTQEQLAMLLGVSRQSVNKWEAERSYPEIDKLLKLCDLFDCTLDELIRGDLTSLPDVGVGRMPEGGRAQDVVGYDEAMQAYAQKVSMGIIAVTLGCSITLLMGGILSSIGVDSTYAAIMALAGLAVGAALFLPAIHKRKTFFKEHPFVEDFYTIDTKRQARSARTKGVVVGLCFVFAGIAAAILLQADVWFAGSAFVLLAGVGLCVAARSMLLARRCDVEAYNETAMSFLNESQIDALGDEDLQARARLLRSNKAICSTIMGGATAVALLLLFVPVLHAERWFWLSWVIGGIGCGAVKALHSRKTD